MKTGEGKTLVATMPIYLNALTGRGVHGLPAGIQAEAAEEVGAWRSWQRKAKWFPDFLCFVDFQFF